MCGIIIYKGEKRAINGLFEIATINKHRGDDDGFGYYDFTNKKLVKTMLEFDEVTSNKISSTRKDEVEKELKKRLPVVIAGLEAKTNFIAFHHRKASVGSAKYKNTHPMEVKRGVVYMQNGTVKGGDLLKRYLEIYDHIKFKNDTDTELVANFTEKTLDSFGYTETFNKITKLFKEIGVLVRIDKDKKEVIVLKDKSRTLYLYQSKKNILLISEPLFELKKFDKCFRLDYGIFKLSEDGFVLIGGVMEDVTEKISKYLEMKSGTIKCDGCDAGSPTIRVGDNKDYCLSCLTMIKPEELKEKPKKEILLSEGEGIEDNLKDVYYPKKKDRYQRSTICGYRSEYWDD